MLRSLVLVMFIFASVNAREYKDPSKKQKKGLLEVGQTPPAQVVEEPVQTSKTDEVKPVTENSKDEAKAQYCGCVNLAKLITKKYEMTEELIRNDVISDSDYSIRNALANTERNTKAAIKKAAYKHSIDRTEVECDAIKISYNKISDMKEDIQAAGLACNLVDI